MDRRVVLSRLHGLTGCLHARPQSRADDLRALDRELASHLAANPDFTISGNVAAHEAADPIDDDHDLTAQFAHVADVLDRAPAVESAALVFRRETAFRSDFLGNSVPEWGSGMAVARTFGPFVDDHGVLVWYDVFEPIRLVSVFISGSETPVLRIPLWGSLVGRQSYRIQGGSVWIASDVVARMPTLKGSYTGLRVEGGTLELTQNATVVADQLEIGVTTRATLKLNLDQQAAPAGPHDAGADAAHASVELPHSFELKFGALGSSLTAGPASCRVFGCRADMQYRNAAPVWPTAVNQILVPFVTRIAGEDPVNFAVGRSESRLFHLKGAAAIEPTSCGWLLPVTTASPAQLGAAAGTGSLCVGLKAGLTAVWKGLQGGSTKLVHPAIIVDPVNVALLDFFASNPYARERWRLWKNAPSAHHSMITLTFGKAFPLVFVSSTANSEALFFFCGHQAAIDRPVDANGKPFEIASKVALGGILQTGTAFKVLAIDNDLVTDAVNPASVFARHSIVLKNALFRVGQPHSLLLVADLVDDHQLAHGVLALTFAIQTYVPTLPDPYVSTYTPLLRDPAGMPAGGLQRALAGFVNWPDAEAPPNVYFKFAPLDQPALGEPAATRNFQNGVRTFNRTLPVRLNAAQAALPADPHVAVPTRIADVPPVAARGELAARSAEVRASVAALETSPLYAHIRDKAALVDRTLAAAARVAPEQSSFLAAAASVAEPRAATVSSSRTMFGRDAFLLLDVSTRADQMGVSVGAALAVEQNERGATLKQVPATALMVAAPSSADMPLQIVNLDVVASARNTRAVTLPQISWEPVWNIPLAIEGPPDPQDLITVAPGLVTYENDGIPTRIFSESPFPIPIAPLPVTRHFLQEFHDEHSPRSLKSIFTLPFALIAQADFNRSLANPPQKNTRLDFHMPHFAGLRGGLQIKARAPESATPARKSPAFPGFTLQLDNIKWSLFGLPLPGSTLGNVVKTIFNLEFTTNKPKVPVERLELSGYGASMFSNWLDEDAAIAEVSQATFDVIVGRTAHEVVQVRSILYPFGVHVVRTITLMRSANGYVFRSDSGWKAESDGFYDFDYAVNLEGQPPIQVNDPYEFHVATVKGVSNVREIRDYPSGGTFTSSFRLNDPDLPPAVRGMSLAQWTTLFKSVTSLNDLLDVRMQAVVFDADVHLDAVASGGRKDPASGDFLVQSRKMLGYVQLAPSAVLVPAHVFADLLKFQNGSLGGPVDCVVDVANSKQRMRLSRVDVNPALDGGGKSIFVSAARGSLVLPPDGSWSVVKQHTDTGDVKPVEEGQSVPLIKQNGNTNYRIANPADVVVPTTSKIAYGVIQSTGTQKLLFAEPQFTLNDAKLKSAQTYFADAYKLLNSKSIFPNVANALGLTNAEKSVDILGEGLMRMADRTVDLNSLLPPTYQYAFVDEPGVLRIYAEYKNAGGGGGKLKLGIDSAAATLADKWKANLSNISLVVDLGPFTRMCWVDGNFNAGSGLKPKYDVPHLQFGPDLQPVVDILRVLAALSGDDFDRGMDVGMSNAPESWEYKFDCSKEIPVIKFPPPAVVLAAPTPPLKLEVGLKVGFYFNETISVATDLKQLVPACGAYVEFYGRLEVQCFTLAVAAVYAVGQVNLGIAADTKAGVVLRMKYGFGAEIVVGLPVVANVSVLYMVEIEVTIASSSLDVAGLLLFRGSADICGGLVSVCIQIEAGGGVHRGADDKTSLIAQVSFSIDICILWVIDIEFSDSWQETRQIA